MKQGKYIKTTLTQEGDHFFVTMHSQAGSLPDLKLRLRATNREEAEAGVAILSLIVNETMRAAGQDASRLAASLKGQWFSNS